MVRLPLPPGGNARIRKAPQSGHVGRTWPMRSFCAGSDSRQFQKVGNPRNPREPVSVLLTEHLNLDLFARDISLEMDQWLSRSNQATAKFKLGHKGLK
jgi:hypothetical protein